MNKTLACFGVSTEVPRVYWPFAGAITETGIGGDGQWYTSAIAAPNAPSMSPDSAIACFGADGAATRVYYFDALGHVIEIAWGNDQWVATDASQAANAPAAARGSDMACFCVGGNSARVYYFDQQNNVIELGWGANAAWYASSINGPAGAPAAAAGSGIACFGLDGQASRVYYFDANGEVVELAFANGGWISSPVGANAGARASGSGKAITCFGVNGTTPRVYYFDSDGNPIELGIGADQQWYSGIIFTSELLAARDSGITCFGVNGAATRLYYFEVDGNLVEVGWGDDAQWYSANLSAAINAPRSIGAITSFAEGGHATRLYYITGSPLTLWEVRWIGSGWSVAPVFQFVQ